MNIIFPSTGRLVPQLVAHYWAHETTLRRRARLLSGKVLEPYRTKTAWEDHGKPRRAELVNPASEKINPT